jgi:hypothetical protein
MSPSKRFLGLVQGLLFGSEWAVCACRNSL